MPLIVALDSETLGLSDDAWAAFDAYGELVRHTHTPPDEALIRERCKGAEIVLSNKVPLLHPVLSQLPDLKLICVLATGTNNVDLEAARRLGISVRNVPAYSTPSVAQHAVALLLELTNRAGYYNASVQKGDWIRSRQFCYWRHAIPELAGRTVGLVGFGDIGRATGAILNAFGMRVLAYARTPRNPPGWSGFAFASIEEIFSQADVISLHCPQTPENAGFVDAALLETVKPGALLINTARGALVNETDLRAALDCGRIGGAAIDVIDGEPMRAAHPLLGAPNCIITPHLAWASVEARQRLLDATLANIRSHLGLS